MGGMGIRNFRLMWAIQQDRPHLKNNTKPLYLVSRSVTKKPGKCTLAVHRERRVGLGAQQWSLLQSPRKRALRLLT